MDGPDDSLTAGADYREFNLRVFLPGIRAWHTVALGLALLLVGVGAVLYFSGAPQRILPLSATGPDPARALLIALAIGARAALCILAWRADYVTVYGKWALPLAILGHTCINA